jgi:hypothetical protein
MGRIERRLFILDWLQSVELRRQANARSALFSALGGAASALVGLCVLGTTCGRALLQTWCSQTATPMRAKSRVRQRKKELPALVFCSTNRISSSE